MTYNSARPRSVHKNVNKKGSIRPRDQFARAETL